MNAASSERVGVLVIRIWTEAGSQPRARITAALDIAAEVPTLTIAAASPDEACQIVRSLLLEFFDPGPTQPDDAVVTRGRRRRHERRHGR